MPKIVGYARYYIEKIRILYVGSFGSWTKFTKEVPPLPPTLPPPHAYSGFSYMGWAFWDGWRRLDQIGWILGPIMGWDGWKKAEGMDSWFSYIP